MKGKFTNHKLLSFGGKLNSNLNLIGRKYIPSAKLKINSDLNHHGLNHSGSHSPLEKGTKSY